MGHQNHIMIDSYKLFESQILDACRIYKHLRIRVNDGKQYLVGSIDVYNVDKIFVSSFLVEIHWNEGFPYRFPTLYEVGGDIPVNADWHKYTDNSCCLTVEPDEIEKCARGITVLKFIEQIVLPYLANQLYRKTEGHFFDEYPHGSLGLIRYYTELMGTSDSKKWIEYLEYAFGKKKLSIGRNETCICGNGKKFKKCHNKVFERLRIIGLGNIIRNIKSIT